MFSEMPCGAIFSKRSVNLYMVFPLLSCTYSSGMYLYEKLSTTGQLTVNVHVITFIFFTCHPITNPEKL